MEVIKLITTNKNKVFLLNQILDKNKQKLRVEMLDYAYPRLKRTDDVRDVVRYAAKHSARKFSNQCLVVEMGIYIDALAGFPGINSFNVLKRIGNEGIIKLLQNETNRKIELRSALGFCAPGKDTKIFYMTLNGSIADKPEGENELGFEAIFIPEGYKVTFGQDNDLRNKLLAKPCLNFAKHYLK